MKCQLPSMTGTACWPVSYSRVYRNHCRQFDLALLKTAQHSTAQHSTAISTATPFAPCFSRTLGCFCRHSWYERWQAAVSSARHLVVQFLSLTDGTSPIARSTCRWTPSSASGRQCRCWSALSSTSSWTESCPHCALGCLWPVRCRQRLLLRLQCDASEGTAAALPCRDLRIVCQVVQEKRDIHCVLRIGACSHSCT